MKTHNAIESDRNKLPFDSMNFFGSNEWNQNSCVRMVSNLFMIDTYLGRKLKILK